MVAIGNFDGVHLGHQKILSIAKTHAKRLSCDVTVLTFSPHPTFELRPESRLKLLMTYEEKRNQLAHFGVDYCVEETFDAAFAKTTAHDFFHVILKDRLKAQVIVVGSDFFFGHRREGTIDLLRKYCADSNILLEQVPPVLVQGTAVSSSRIRECLNQGDLTAANELLGRPFFYNGEVVHGDKRGRLLGFPTANMNCEEKFPLLTGVYATSVIWRDQQFQSVTNIGTRPTFTAQATAGTVNNIIPIKIETHLLGQDLNLYDQQLEVRFHRRLREEKRFSSVEELKEQISADIKLAKQLLSTVL